MKKITTGKAMYVALIGFIVLILGTVGALAVRADDSKTEISAAEDVSAELAAEDVAAELLSGDARGPLIASVNGISQETSVQRSPNVGSESTLDVYQNGDVAQPEVVSTLHVVEASTASRDANVIDVLDGTDQDDETTATDRIASRSGKSGTDVNSSPSAATRLDTEVVDARGIAMVVEER